MAQKLHQLWVLSADAYLWCCKTGQALWVPVAAGHSVGGKPGALFGPLSLCPFGVEVEQVQGTWWWCQGYGDAEGDFTMWPLSRGN